jgi:hypothetical protein
MSKPNLMSLIAFSSPLFFAVSALAQPENIMEEPNLECTFDRHYAVYLREDKVEKYGKEPTKLTIIDEKTSNETLSLDGLERATNSTAWSLIFRNEYERRYIGNTGDKVTVYYRPEDAPRQHTASLQWGTILGYAYTSVGFCLAS